MEMRIAKRTRVRRVMLTVTAIIFAVIAIVIIVFVVIVAGRADPAPAGNTSIKVVNVSSVRYG